MRDQHVFAERLLAETHHGIERDAGQIGIGLPVVRRKSQRHQAGLELGDGNAELFGNVITERCRAGVGDGQTAGRNHQ